MPSYIYLVREGFSVGRGRIQRGGGRLCQVRREPPGPTTYLLLPTPLFGRGKWERNTGGGK